MACGEKFDIARLMIEMIRLSRMSSERPESVTELVWGLRPALMAYFLRRVHGHAEAEDLTQEVFSRIAGHADSQIQSGGAYVFQIAANLLRDKSRRETVRRQYRQTLGEIEASNVDWIDPFRIAAGRDSIAAMRAALNEVDEITGAIFALYRLEHMGKDVIADTFGMSVRTVEKHLTKAMAFLTARFGDEL